VIAEQEHLPEPILTQDFMVNVIRSYGSGAQSAVSGHLEQTLRQFLGQNHVPRLKPLSGTDAPPRLRPAEESFKGLAPGRLRDTEKDREDSNLIK
jgi:hypothetical protein